MRLSSATTATVVIFARCFRSAKAIVVFLSRCFVSRLLYLSWLLFNNFSLLLWLLKNIVISWLSVGVIAFIKVSAWSSHILWLLVFRSFSIFYHIIISWCCLVISWTGIIRIPIFIARPSHISLWSFTSIV